MLDCRREYGLIKTIMRAVKIEVDVVVSLKEWCTVSVKSCCRRWLCSRCAMIPNEIRRAVNKVDSVDHVVSFFIMDILFQRKWFSFTELTEA